MRNACSVWAILISVIEFKVDDIDKADVVSRQLEGAAGKGFMTTNWKEQNQALFHALNMERLVTYITVGLIVFVAALNILISLNYDGHGKKLRTSRC